jgi:hypothetical protein
MCAKKPEGPPEWNQSLLAHNQGQELRISSRDQHTHPLGGWQTRHAHVCMDHISSTDPTLTSFPSTRCRVPPSAHLPLRALTTAGPAVVCIPVTHLRLPLCHHSPCAPVPAYSPRRAPQKHTCHPLTSPTLTPLTRCIGDGEEPRLAVSLVLGLRESGRQGVHDKLPTCFLESGAADNSEKHKCTSRAWFAVSSSARSALV